MNFAPIKLLLAYRKLPLSPVKEIPFAATSSLRHVGIILDRGDEAIVTSFEELFNGWKLGAVNIEVVYCSASGKEDTTDHVVFRPADISCTGSIKNPQVTSFLDRDFDLLISFTDKAADFSDYLVKASGAGLKVGRRQEKQIFDLVINTSIGEVEVFTSELKKYLRIINK